MSDFQERRAFEFRRPRFRKIPLRMLVPNVITLLAIVAGLTAIRLSTEGRFELALGAIVFAALLDGIDGRVARLIKGQSKFGAELDSLADFVNFGVAPGLILYFWQLHAIGNVGWIAAMIFAISGGLRLARFNATMDDPNKPAYAANYFTGVPAPAGAITVLLPMYLAFLGVAQLPAALVALYMIVIAALMVSRLPVFSGKRAGSRVRRELVLPIIMFAVLFIALLVSYPWHVLTVGAVLYLVCLPWSWMSYRRQEQRAAETKASTPAVETETPVGDVSAPPISPASGSDERPPRLN
jgi:CDP-diacylglycerol--serine O-phosphatidyltransferase